MTALTQMTTSEVRDRYVHRMTGSHRQRVQVLSELNGCSAGDIELILEGLGILPTGSRPERSGRGRRPSFDDDFARTLYDRGLTDNAIANYVGVDRNVIANWRWRMGLPVHPDTDWHKKRTKH